MQMGLYWIKAKPETSGLNTAFWTIGRCADGEDVEPINPNFAGVRVEAVGPFIGSASELTGQTAKYVQPPAPAWRAYKKPKPKELTP